MATAIALRFIDVFLSASKIHHLSEDPTTHVVNFCRTPTWILPPVNQESSVPRLKTDVALTLLCLDASSNTAITTSRLQFVPSAMRLHRWVTFLQVRAH